MTQSFCRLSFSVLLLSAFGLLTAQTIYSQTEKLGIVKYTPPPVMTKTIKENVVLFSEFNQATGKYCLITVYGATPGTGNAKTDFVREWTNLVVKQMKTEDANPKTDTSAADGWTILAAGSSVESEVGKALAFLTVISGTGRTVSILAVFNDPAYVKQVDTFIGGIDLDKPAAAANNSTAASGPTSASGAPAFDSNGDLIIPQPSRQLTTADIAGVWIDGPNRMTTEYVYSGSGHGAGRDTTAFQVKTTFNSNGTYSSFFNSVRKKYDTEGDTKVGSYSIVGRLLSIQGTGYEGRGTVTTKWVIRGWIELPSMTVLKLAGPWYDNAEIPERNFTDFGPESRFLSTTKWVRAK
ncbi:hypothetical protein BH10ACI3_BH10ACI3_28240 [soil metagenome]